MISTQSGLAAFGQTGQHLTPFLLDPKTARCATMGVQCCAPDTGDLFDIGRAALAALDFYRFDADGRQFRQQVQGVEAGGFLQGMEAFAADQEGPLHRVG